MRYTCAECGIIVEVPQLAEIPEDRLCNECYEGAEEDPDIDDRE